MGKTVLKLLWLAGGLVFLALIAFTFGALMFLEWGGSVYLPVGALVGTFLLGLGLWASAGRVFPDRWP